MDYSGFHESYYAHSCPIIPEKDVLYTDIIGTGIFYRLKRWWHGLFLLSTTNEISRSFYNSSHAMRIERFRQFRKYRSRIHPMSKFTHVWNNLILFAFILNKILCRFTSTMIFENIWIYVYYLGACLELIIVLDLYVSMKTGYVDKQLKTVVLDSKKSFINFISKKLFLHILSIIPVHWFLFMKYGSRVDCGLCKTSRFICVLKVFSAFSLYRVFEMSEYWTKRRYSPAVAYTMRFLRIGIVGFISMLQFHDIVDVIWIVKIIKEQQVDASSFIGKLIIVRYGLVKHTPNHMVLCFDISRIFKSLLLFSFGKMHSKYMLDKLSSVIAYLIANSFYAWSLLECHAFVCCIYYPKDKLVKTRNSVVNLLRSRQLSDDIKVKVDQYFEFKPTRWTIMQLGNSLYASISPVLKNEATLSCYSSHIMRIPLFSEWPMHLIESLALMLKQEVYLSKDIVTTAWTQSKGLMIVDVGVLAVYSLDNVETGHLIDGDYFGEMSLVTDQEVLTSYVVAVTTCKMLILEKSAFRSYMRNYPRIFYEMKRRLQKQQNEDDDNGNKRKKPDPSVTFDPKTNDLRTRKSL